MLKIGVLASGRGTNLQSIIDSIEAGELEAEIRVVISDREEARALERADRYDIANYFVNPAVSQGQKDFERAMIEILEDKGAELIVLAGFMRLLSSYFIGHYNHRVMNIHPSLLPSFPGLHAQKQALDYGVKVSGCTVHFADEGMDTGPVILQEVVPVNQGDTEETLAARILEKEHIIYPEAIKLYSQDRLEIEDGKVKIREKNN